MANYSIKKDCKAKKLVYIECEAKGYDFSPKPESLNNSLKINKIILINPSLIDKILTMKFKQRYKRILMIVLSIINSNDSSEGDFMLALDEIAKMRDIVLHKYQTFLKKEKEKVFLEQLRALENNLRLKFQEMQNYNKYIKEKNSIKTGTRR